VKKAGAVSIPDDDPELLETSREVRGHALTLSLLGNWLRLAFGGDIRKRDRAELTRADEENGGHAFRVMAAYERWFAAPDADGKSNGARQLAALRLLGFFDRPAEPEDLAALRAAPPVPGLTEALFLAPKGAPDDTQANPEPIPKRDWSTALTRLADAGLFIIGGEGQIDSHPLVRDYLGAALKARSPEAFREGHRRLFERLKAAAPYRPEGLDGLQPLYRAVAHGCLAGRWEEACVKVYQDRILRGTGHDGFYSWRKLGAFGANLGALACLFEDRWTRPAGALAEPDRAWLLNETAIQLRALGRLGEALEPVRAGAEMPERRKHWENAARGYGNLSELELTLGRIAEAVADARRALDHAERSSDAFERMSKRTSLADALQQGGENAEASRLLAEAEALQEQRQPQFPILYSVQGFGYCDLLLAGAERAAWRAGTGAQSEAADALAACEPMARRAGQTLEWAMVHLGLLDIGLDRLTLARCALYADLLQGLAPSPEVRSQAEQALDCLRLADRQDYIPFGLLTRAWVRRAAGDPNGARADLDEAERIAARGSMRLHLADCALYRARLFRDRVALAEARRLIDACGYRRVPELEDAEAAAMDWPDPFR
jgi:tetratricopeptide (TPR) repeat protein